MLFCPTAFSSSAQPLCVVKALMGLEGWDPSQPLEVAKEAPGRRSLGLCMCRVSAVEGGDVSSVADASPISLGLHSKSKDDALASLLPSALSPACCSLCPTVPEGSPHPSFSCFPRLPGAGSALGPRRQARGSLASCQRSCLPARSVTSQPAAGGPGRYRLALGPARDSGISPGPAR